MKNVLTKSFLLTVAFSLLCAERLPAADAAAAARSAEQAEKSGKYLKALLEKATDEARQKLPPRPTKPYDPVAATEADKERRLERKKQLAPWLYQNGEVTKEGKAFLENTAARAKALKASNSPAIHPKVDFAKPLKQRQTLAAGGAALRGGGGASSASSTSARLEMVDWFYQSQFNRTVFELWLLDAPANEWWDIFRASSMSPSAWVPARVGPPDGASGNIQQFFVVVSGQPQHAFFQIFLNQDIDYDGIPDGYEVAYFKTDPNNPDSNSTRDANNDGTPDHPGLAGNQLADGDEDFDGDGLSTIYELTIGVNPLVAQSPTDSDTDGLPDWLETLITVYTGDPSPAPTTDSDGDGLNNISEWRMRLDPSWGFDRVLGNYANLPDDQRVVLHQSLELQSPVPGFDEGQSLIPSDSYFDASVANYFGTTAQLTVLKDTDAAGNSAPGTDTFKWGVAYQTPPSFVPAQNVPDPDPADGAVEDLQLFLQVTSIGTGTWEAAKVTELLDTLSEPTLIHIQQRFFTRMWAKFRTLQLMMVAEQLPQGLVLRTRTIMAEIHTQATLLRKTTLVIGQNYASTQALARMGRFVPVAGSICTVVSVGLDANALVPIYHLYFLDVKRRCDNNNDTALELALALSSVADAAFPAPVNAAFFWPIYWNYLANFDGWASSC